jgi:diguanylate cyclase (GGDEF)-like protein
MPSARKWIWTSSGSLLFLIAASGIATLMLVILSAVWAGSESDLAALDRQRQLVESRLHDQVQRVSQDIRLMGAGYASLLIATADFSGQASLGPAEMFNKIVTSVFGYDKTFLVGPDGELALHADAETIRRYKWVRPLLKSMLRDVQTKQREAQERNAEASDPTASAVESEDFSKAELMRLEGRPSIIGIVPVASADRPQGRQPAGAADRYLIAFRFLDGIALDVLSREQGLNGARFARTADADEQEVAFQIEATASKEPIGFIIWKPDLPGSRVVGRLVPALSVAALIIAALFIALIVRLRRSMAKLEASEHHARHLALHDVLTALPNRAMFAARFKDCLSDMKSWGQRTAVAFIDLDQFKAVNDSFGHAAGDELIRIAADRMRGLMREGDTLARIGGDEFALLLPDIGKGNDGYMQLCERIVAAMSQPFSLRGGEAIAHIGCSIGVAVLADPSQTASEVLRFADVALYEAKSSGRGLCLEFDPSMDHGNTAREGLKNDLRAVFENTESPGAGLEVFFQTIHRSGAEDEISGAEALVRWRHDRHGLLTPDKFIPLAEEIGLIDELGHFVLKQACLAAVLWPSAGYVAVNVSPTQLRRPNFADEVLAVLDETGLPPSRLELELTESALFDIAEQARATLARLREKGVLIALDDFGTGFSSLSHLTRFGIDRIKIDRSFVSLLGTQANGAAIVSAIVGLGRSLGIATTAEGVETAAQRDFLVAIGCSDLQGYLFSRPAPFDEMVPSLSGGRKTAAV